MPLPPADLLTKNIYQILAGQTSEQLGEITAHRCIVRAFENAMLCVLHSTRIAVCTCPLLLRHTVPSTRLLRQPMRTSAQLCQRLPPAALPDACKVWFRALRFNANDGC
jgi:hypothetical protein